MPRQNGGGVTTRCVAVCVFLLLPVTVAGHQIKESASISGAVYAIAADSAGLSDVLVRLCDPAANPIRQSFSDQSGNFGFQGLEPGVYVLTFDASGYERTETQVDLSVIFSKTVSVVLRPVANSRLSTVPAVVSVHELSMPARARDLMAAGRRELYVDKNARAALDDFRRALSEAPGYYEAEYQTGMAFVALGRRSDAVQSFRKAFKASSGRFGDADVVLGTLLLDQGNVKDGEASLDKGVSLNPNSWLGFFELGKLEFDRGCLDQALIMAERARSLSPNRAVVYRLLANVHLKQGNTRAFLEDIDSYLKLDPNSPAGVRARELREQIQNRLANEKHLNDEVPSSPEK